MTRLTTIGILMGAAMLATVSTASAQRWGREATPRAGVCFYEDINFGGRYFCSPEGAATTSVPSGMNDRISSVRLFGGSAVTLFRDPNYRGDTRTVTSDIPDLRGMGFNDRLSSYQVQNRRAVVQGNNGGYAVPRGQVAYPNGTVYQNGNAYPNGSVNNNSRWTYRNAQQTVRQSYHAVLGRDPDAQGLNNWTQQLMNNNWTQRDLENALRQSDEFRAERNNGNGNYRTNRR
jgi:hypothetical protein